MATGGTNYGSGPRPAANPKKGTTHGLSSGRKTNSRVNGAKAAGQMARLRGKSPLRAALKKYASSPFASKRRTK